MKKIIFIFVAVMGIMFTACNNDEIIVPEEILQSTDNNISETSTNYLVPIDDALAELNAVLASIDNQPQNAMGRSMAPRKQRTIGSIETLAVVNNANSTLKRAPSAGAVATDTLLYLVNFQDDMGYAVLAADARISTSVLAIVESGSISAESFDEESELYDSRIDYGFDLGFDLHAGGDDYYVSGAIESSINSMILGHAMMEVAAQKERLGFGPCEPGTPGGGGGGGTGGGNTGGGGSNTGTRTETGAWVDGKKVNPMLTTVWGQDSPFNDACPRSRWFIFDKLKKGPAGCVPIAVAQIIAYHEYPKNLRCNSVNVDWKGIKEIYNINDKPYYSTSTESNREGLAQLVRNIGDKCHTIYKPTWAFALPSNAKNCISNYFNTNASLHLGYDKNENKITNMLDNGNPVFIASISGIVSGHAWVIDGSINQTRTTKIIDNSTGETINSSTEERLLLHCNWGWHGKCNGYYVSGIFNTKKGAVDTEDGQNSGVDTENFTWAFHIITYDNPNK